MKTLMTAHVTSKGGRAGHVESDDGIISLDLASANSGKKGSNPEQLFAAGYSACFGSALEAVAKAEKAETGEITVKSAVSLNQDDTGSYFISVEMDVALPKLSADDAQKIVEKAHQVCPYSKATRGNVDVHFTVNQTKIKAAA